MDTCEQMVIEAARPVKKRQIGRRKETNRRRDVGGGASVARVARRHGVNANQVFYWRKQYREGRLGSVRATSSCL